MTAAPPTRASRTMLAVAVAVTMTVAAGLGTILVLEQKAGSSSTVVNDGPTFYQALAAVNATVNGQSGGPWTLYAVWGIATPTPFAPNALGWFGNNQTVNSCGLQFNGLTLWNGSIPLFKGSFESGTAPFWQFGFFSNASQSIVIATDVRGVAHAYPSMGMTSRCARFSDLGAAPWTWARTFSPFPSDSPAMAESAWKAIGQHWMSSDQPAWEGYVIGFSYWGSANPNGIIVKFARCGQVGATGVQPVAYVGLNADGSWNSFFNGTQGCGDVVSLGPPPVYGSYVLNFSPPQLSVGSSTTMANQSFQAAYGRTSGPVDDDAGGLVSWMTTLNLTTATGQRLPSVMPACANWVPSLTGCHANGLGWYAVLLSSGGAWLDSYPSSPNGTAWEVPNVSLVSNQYLVVVVPSSWNAAGDVFSINGTVSVVLVNGSVTL